MDTEEPVEILFHIDNFPGLGSLLLPGRSTNFTTRLRLQDQSGRRLHLQAAVTNSTSHGLKVCLPIYVYLFDNLYHRICNLRI